MATIANTRIAKIEAASPSSDKQVRTSENLNRMVSCDSKIAKEEEKHEHIGDQNASSLSNTFCEELNITDDINYSRMVCETVTCFTKRNDSNSKSQCIVDNQMELTSEYIKFSMCESENMNKSPKNKNTSSYQETEKPTAKTSFKYQSHEGDICCVKCECPEEIREDSMFSDSSLDFNPESVEHLIFDLSRVKLVLSDMIMEEEFIGLDSGQLVDKAKILIAEINNCWQKE